MKKDLLNEVFSLMTEGERFLFREAIAVDLSGERCCCGDGVDGVCHGSCFASQVPGILKKYNRKKSASIDPEIRDWALGVVAHNEVVKKIVSKKLMGMLLG